MLNVVFGGPRKDKNVVKVHKRVLPPHGQNNNVNGPYNGNRAVLQTERRADEPVQTVVLGKKESCIGLPQLQKLAWKTLERLPRSLYIRLPEGWDMHRRW